MTRINGINFTAQSHKIVGGNNNPPRENEPIVKVRDNKYVTYYDFVETKSWRTYEIKGPNGNNDAVTAMKVAKAFAKYTQDDGNIDVKETSQAMLDIFTGGIGTAREETFPLLYAATADKEGISQSEQSTILHELFARDNRSCKEK